MGDRLPGGVDAENTARVAETLLHRATSMPYGCSPSGNFHSWRTTGFCLWFTGLSGSGKSTIAAAVVDELRRRGHRVEVLDGDEVREQLSAGLGFSQADRDINIRRIGWVAALLARNGVFVVTAAISPYRAVRDELRAQIDSFVEVFVDTPLAACAARDVKGLYTKALAGEMRGVHGRERPVRAAGDTRGAGRHTRSRRVRVGRRR